MSAISRLTCALASGTQETTLALANLNFDFSLVKLEAPAEFRALGANLSSKRKRNAEDGSAHVTARKLGALFAGDLPDTPHLFSAYGRRVSEIAEMPKLNPRGKPQVDGAFAGHVGADGTSIWAAATSGKGAMAVHLLACMLARIWTGPEAISVWSEIVTAQKALLQKRIQGVEFPIAFAAASQIEISRSQLAEWDASARAWLCTADEAKVVQQKQLMLIIANIGIPIASGATVLSNVLEAWKDALTALDKLVSGMGQRIQTGAVLLGLSAWHLYPDMSVLSPKSITVEQRDHIIAPGGLATIGMQNTNPERDGVSWTMPLAHLRYYGKPVLSNSSLQSDSARIPFSHLLQVSFGALLGGWGPPGKDVVAAARFIIALSDFLQKKSSDERPFHAKAWVKVVADAASTFLHSTGEDRVEFEKLIALGSRRCTMLLGRKHMPVFGLTTLRTHLSLLAGEEDRIQVLRSLAASAAINIPGALIRYDRSFNTSEGDSSDGFLRYTYAFATLQPDVESQTYSPHNQFIHPHRRWVPDDTGHMTAWCIDEIEANANELCHKYDIEDVYSFEYHQFISVYQSLTQTTKARSLFDWLSDSVGQQSNELPAGNFVTLKLLYGNPLLAAVYVPMSNWSEKKVELDLSFITRILEQDKMDSGRLELHLNNPLKIPGQYQEYMDSLSVLSMAVAVYSRLPEARVNLAVTKTPLARPKSYKAIHVYNSHGLAIHDSPALLKRKHAFALVALFETGSLDLDPDDLREVVAISTGNSLYISEQLLSDPSRFDVDHALRRVVGNIGKSGVSLLTSPKSPAIREPDFDRWRFVQHAPFNGNLELHFEETSLHLSLTGYELPLNLGDHGGRDQLACFVEAAVSAYDGGRWVADLDILNIFPDVWEHPLAPECLWFGDNTIALAITCQCCDSERSSLDELPPISSVDCWDEFLDPPPNSIAFRAGKNWLARLAATAVARQRAGCNVCLLGSNVCWRCYL